jgi:selT/selW/selH-like putative selenoprotein
LAKAEVALKRSSGGVFEVSVDGTLAFSKKSLGRFPTDAEIDALARPKP